MTKRADKELLRAVLEPRKHGALQKISDACAAGADPDAICPECSTSAGPVRAGSTLLTHSVHEWALKAVERLLECGADPNLADQNGWTPWMASTLADESKRDRIQAVLTKYGANKSGEHIGHLARAIADGDADKAAALIKTDRDLEVLSTFRVDLMGHQIRSHNTPMLELLLERNMRPTSTNFLNAVRGSSLPAVDLLLRYGMLPESSEDNETPLMTAAAMGEMKIVQRLVEAGADVNRSADDNSEWTASFYAKQAGKTEVAEWLSQRMNEEILNVQDQREAARDPKFERLYEQATGGESLSTDNIVEVLKRWDTKYGLTVTDATPDSVGMEFASLPEDLDGLYREVLDLCPDATDSGPEVREELTKNKTLFLWWD